MNQHWLRKDEQQDIIRRYKRQNGVTVKRRDEKRLKFFIVKGEGIFKCCAECGHSWTSHHTSIGVDLSRARVFKRYWQRCQKCRTCQVFPRFTVDRFEEIISLVIHLYEMRKNGYRTCNNRPTLVHGNTQEHKMEDCGRCQELGRRC